MNYLKPILSSQQILNLLPFSYPFLLLDQVVELVPGKRAVGLKNVTYNEPYHQGHFPEKPIMPGVLIVDACGQLTAVVCRTAGLMDGKGNFIGSPNPKVQKAPIEYLAAINRFKFVRTVVPGDQLVLESNIGKKLEGLLNATVRATVQGSLVAEGSLIVTIGTVESVGT